MGGKVFFVAWQWKAGNVFLILLGCPWKLETS